MKKLVLCLAGAMMALSLAACGPTQVAEESKPKAAQVNPEGVTPELIEKQNETTVDPKTLVDPDAPVMQTIMVYSVNEDGSGLVRSMADASEVTEDTEIDALIESGDLEEGIYAETFDIEGGEKAGPGVAASETGDGERIGILNFTELDADADKLVLYAIANTFCDNFELDKLEIQVAGQPYENSLITDGYLYYEDDYEKLN